MEKSERKEVSVISSGNEGTKSCLECRLVSGLGVTGGGLYVGYYARKQPTTVGRIFGGIFSASLIGLGLCRLFDLPPFGSTPKVFSSFFASK